MGTAARGVVIVTLHGVRDSGGLKKRIMMIHGVESVKLNILNQKLVVRYAGDETTLQRISSTIEEAGVAQLKSERATRASSKKETY